MKNRIVTLVGLAWLALSVEPAHAITNALGTTNLLEGPAAGSDSVVLAATPTLPGRPRRTIPGCI